VRAAERGGARIAVGPPIRERSNKANGALSRVGGDREAVVIEK